MKSTKAYAGRTMGTGTRASRSRATFGGLRAFAAVVVAGLIWTASAGAVTTRSTISATEGQPFSGQVGSFSEPCPLVVSIRGTVHADRSGLRASAKVEPKRATARSGGAVRRRQIR